MTEILPRLLVWDGSQPMRAYAAPSDPHASTVGVANYLHQLCGFGSPANGGARTYETLATVSYGPARARVVESSAARISMSCIWPLGGSTAERYGSRVYRLAAAGHFDDLVRAQLNTYPIGTSRPIEREPIRVRWAFLHEPENYSPDDVDPRDYRAAIAHLIEVAVDEAQLMGATPDEFGVGGLLLTEGMAEDTGLPWMWWEWLSARALASGYLAGFWDTYFKLLAYDPATMGHRSADVRLGIDGKRYVHESFREKIERHLLRFPVELRARAIVAETTCALDVRGRDTEGVVVGSEHHQLAWFAEARAMLDARRLEALMTFHKEDGPSSGLGPLCGPGHERIAAQLGYRSRDYNRARAA